MEWSMTQDRQMRKRKKKERRKTENKKGEQKGRKEKIRRKEESGKYTRTQYQSNLHLSSVKTIRLKITLNSIFNQFVTNFNLNFSRISFTQEVTECLFLAKEKKTMLRKVSK